MSESLAMWKRWLFRTVGLGLLIALISIGIDLAQSYATRVSDSAKLTAYREHLDATDPGWRLEEILAAREANFPPPDRNVITTVRRLKAEEPPALREWQRREGKWLPDAALNRRPTADALADATAVRDAAKDVIDGLRRLRHLEPRGGEPLIIKPDVVGTLLDGTSNVRWAAWALQLDAAVAAARGDSDRAIEDARAALTAAAAIGDEPFGISFLVRAAGATIAKTTIERTLALAEPTAGLAELQAAFAAEDAAPTLAAAFRGERAGMNRLFENIDAGLVDMGQQADPIGLAIWRAKNQRLADYRLTLETLTQYIAIARKPPHERAALFRQVPDPGDDPKFLFTVLLGASWGRLTAADVRTKAVLRSAIAGIACERFRQAHKRWPKELAEIPKDILPAVPLDPYDGQPLRLKPTENGVVVYAVGPDNADDGGRLAADGAAGTDLGFRLWDVPHRGAAPRPPGENERQP